MPESEVSRRTFARALAAGAAVAALPLPRLMAATAPAHDVRLSANENPYGPSPATVEAMTRALGTAARYPDELHAAFRKELAELHAVGTDQVLIGDGSSDIIRCAVAAFTNDKRPLVMADPTFEAPASAAKATGAKVIKLPLLPTSAHDVVGMRRASNETGLLYICNPNNPTATITPKDQMQLLLDSTPTTMIILVDEAYHHYVNSPYYSSVLPQVRLYPNLVVTRTFSKVYGLAGIRCGYAVGQKAAIARMREQQQWDANNVAALAGARAALADTNYVITMKKRNDDTKKWLNDQLFKLDLVPLPSETNFEFIDMKRDVKPLIAKLAEAGVHVGRQFPAMPNYLRVTIGTPEEMEAFVAALKKAK